MELDEETYTTLTKKDIEDALTKCKTLKIVLPVCNWCNKSSLVRPVLDELYICYNCEKKEHEAGRELIGSSPVKDCYIDSNGNIVFP